MVFWIAAIAVAGLLATPLWSRIAIKGASPAALDVRLMFGIIPLWQWKAELDEAGELTTRVRTFILPAKSTLPSFLQKHKPQRKKHSAFALDLSIDRLSLHVSLPWDDGWETLQLYALQRSIAFFAERGLYLHGTKPDLQVELTAPGNALHFAGEAILRMHIFNTLVQTIRKAVEKRWNTRSKN